MVNSDRSLADSGVWFFVWWIAGHTVVAGMAFGLAKLAFGRSTATSTADAAFADPG